MEYALRDGPVQVVVTDGIEDAVQRLLGPDLYDVVPILRDHGDLTLELIRDRFPKRTGTAARELVGEVLIEDTGDAIRYRWSAGPDAPYTYVIQGRDYGHAWSEIAVSAIRDVAAEIGADVVRGVLTVWGGE